MVRKRANKPRKWWHDRRRLARRLRAALLVTALLVGLVAFANLRYAMSPTGPFGVPGGLWRYVSFTIYFVGLGFVLWAVWWLRRHDELPKEA